MAASGASWPMPAAAPAADAPAVPRPWIPAAIAVLLPAAAAGQDVGEIALVPDTGGMILSAIAVPNSYLGRTACAFLGSHPDQYDAIFVFTSAQLNILTRVQQGWPVRRAAMGIGRDVALDTSASFCTSRIRHAVKMGDIDSFSDDPDQRYNGIILFPLTGIQLLAHEFGHQWLAAIEFDRGDGARRCLARGYEPHQPPGMPGDCDGAEPADFNQHWSYYFNSGSVMYGNQVQDLGGGQFELSNPSPKYSPLDQYLMGLRDPQEVPPMFVVDTGDLNGSASLPLPATRTETVNGTRVDFTIDDVIRALGPRSPAREGCHWKGAFIIVHDPAQPPTAAQIARVDSYRRRWETFYDFATDGRGSFDTTLAGSGQGTATCPGQPSPTVDAGMPRDAAPAQDVVVVDLGSPDAGGLDAEEADATAADVTSPGQDATAGADLTFAPQDDAAPRQDPATLTTDDCSCRATGARSSSLAWIAWLAAVLAVVKRRGPAPAAQRAMADRRGVSLSGWSGGRSCRR
jgi:hypothetical protein